MDDLNADTNLNPTQNQNFYVYILESSDHATYVGATVDLDRRLRQHNKEIKGGAHATSARVVKGETWTRVCYVSGFPDWPAALQFEWRLKQLSRKLPSRMFPLERRKKALEQLLLLERSTTKAIPFNQWPTPPQVHWVGGHTSPLPYGIPPDDSL
jgi:predicted GIY-YIG superfamily endonuclease